MTLDQPADREALRRMFLPARVRVLFVGESPPAGGSFFYAADSGLYRATLDAFSAVVPAMPGQSSFLETFARFGCYLEDICAEPVNQLTRRDDGSWRRRLQARRNGERRLADVLVDLRPAVVLTLMKGIAGNVTRAAALAGNQCERHVLTYPSRWHRHRRAYHDELVPLLRDLIRREVVRP